MKKYIFYLLFLFVTISSNSQTNYFIDGTDTIHCKAISYKLSMAKNLIQILYTDFDGQNWVIEGKEDLSTVSTFFIDGVYIDKIPRKIDKPDKYVVWARRVVNGKLKVIYYLNETTTYGIGGATTSAITHFFIKMPDGTLYDIARGDDLKKFIIPYLKKCEAFNIAYKGNFEKDFEDFNSTIRLYNSVCN
jgi:hypothetical protein